MTTVEHREPEQGDAPDSKRSISLRLNVSDHDRIRVIAKRLRARESDVFRFLLRLALAKVAPLSNTRNNGSELLPAFVDYATELTTHFDLDATRIRRVLTADADPSNHIDDDDIELLAMAALPERYLAFRLRELTGKSVSTDEAIPVMRAYLEEKYLSAAAKPEDDQ